MWQVSNLNMPRAMVMTRRTDAELTQNWWCVKDLACGRLLFELATCDAYGVQNWYRTDAELDMCVKLLECGSFKPVPPTCDTFDMAEVGGTK